jgi:creatinine amidohydrolase
MTGGGVELAHDAWPAVEAVGQHGQPRQDPGGVLVLVPLGSTEQHGPHLPFDVDARVAAAVCREVAEALAGGAAGAGADAGERVVVAPVLAYGASGEHQAFGGTLSIGHEALAAVVVELGRSATTWASRVLFVTGHGGNLDGLGRGVARLVAEGRDVAWVPALAGDTERAGDAHAGRTETSLMLHLAPDVVDDSAAAPGATAPLADLLPLLRAAGTRAVAPNGVLGDPTGASAAEGEALLRAAVTTLAGRVRAWDRDPRGMLSARPAVDA